MARFPSTAIPARFHLLRLRRPPRLHSLLIVTINVVFPPGLLSPNAATYCSSRKREKTPLTHNVTCLLAVTGRVFSLPSLLMAGAILTQFVSPMRGKICEASWCRTAFAGTTCYVAQTGHPPLIRRCHACPPDGRRLSALSDALRDVSARKPVATRRKSLCEPLDAYEKDGA